VVALKVGPTESNDLPGAHPRVDGETAERALADIEHFERLLDLLRRHYRLLRECDSPGREKLFSLIAVKDPVGDGQVTDSLQVPAKVIHHAVRANSAAVQKRLHIFPIQIHQSNICKFALDNVLGDPLLRRGSGRALPLPFTVLNVNLRNVSRNRGFSCHQLGGSRLIYRREDLFELGTRLAFRHLATITQHNVLPLAVDVVIESSPDAPLSRYGLLYAA
jgi:hypothetical protein